MPEIQKMSEYQSSGAGGTRLPPATSHRLQNPKWPPVGPKMADGVLKGVKGGHSKQLLQNKFFDPSTPSMRKGHDGGNGKKQGGWGEKEKTDENSGHYIIASR